MKFKKLIMLFTMTLSLFSMGLKESNVNAGVFDAQNAGSSSISNDARYIGRGYNALSGHPIYTGDGFSISRTILDLTNETITNKIVSDFEQPRSSNKTTRTTKKSELAQTFGTDINGGIGGKIAMVSLDIDAHFDRSETVSSAVYEEFQYYIGVHENTRVFLENITLDQLRDSLHKDFKTALYSVKNEDSARALLNNYGTHLFTGYTLGGLMEFTNYYATWSNSIERAENTSLSANIEATIAQLNNISGDFSFEHQYGEEINTQFATSTFLASTYGGENFNAVSIDDIFSYQGGEFSDKKLRYTVWLDSINRREGLVVVGIPETCDIIPLWELLPNKREYIDIKNLLMSVYLNESKKKYGEYILDNKDIIRVGKESEEIEKENVNPAVDGININIYEKTNVDQFNNYYIPNGTGTNLNKFTIPSNSSFSIDFNFEEFSGIELEWDFVSAGTRPFNIVDSRNGIFEVPSTTKKGTYQIATYLHGTDVRVGDPLNITITNGKYSGGLGLESSPYIIANADDLVALSTTTEDWSKHFNLISDIDLSGVTLEPIGNESKAFTGNFNGNYNTIYNFTPKINKNTTTIGLFAINSGTISNLNLNSTKDKTTFKNFEHSLLNGGSYTYTGKNGTFPSNYNPNLNHVISQSYLLSEVLYGGVLCGINNGTINNVEVKNYNLYINNPVDYTKRGDNNASDSTDKMHFGGLVGINKGKIDRALVENVALDIKGYNFFRVNVGGAIGQQDTDNAQAYGILVKNPAIYGYLADVDLNKKDSIASSGGIVGNLLYGKVNSSVITLNENPVGNDPYNTTGKNGIVSAVLGNKTIWSQDYVWTFAGGIAGHVDGGFIEDCLSNIKSMDYIYAHDLNLEEKGSSISYHSFQRTVGAFVGNFLYSKENPSNTTDRENFATDHFKNNAAYNLKLTGYARDDANSGVTSLNGVKVNDLRPSSNANILESTDANNRYYYNQSSMDWELVIDSVDLENDRLIINKGYKKEFFIGERFDTKGLSVQRQTMDEIYDVECFTVDSSNFNNGIVGDYKIIIRAFGLETSYQVSVVAPEGDHIYVELNNSNVEYYEKDKFNPSTVDVYLVTENAVTKELSYGTGVGCYTINGDLTLEEGSNDLVFEYVDTVSKKTLRYTFVVDAKPLEIVEVKMTSIPNQQEYTVGDEFINLNGLVIEVTYENGKVEEFLNGEGCEIIYNPIVYGENTVYISFGDYHIFSFKVLGIYDIDNELLDELEGYIEASKATNDIKIRFDNLKQAEKIIKSIGEDVEIERFAELLAEFNVEKDRLNADIGVINNEVEDMVEISGHLILGFTEIGGFALFTAVLAVILKLL